MKTTQTNRIGANVSWWLSLIFPIAIVLLTVTILLDPNDAEDATIAALPQVSVLVSDGATSLPISGATVSGAGIETVTGADGIVIFNAVAETIEVAVIHPGYVPRQFTLTAGAGGQFNVELEAVAAELPAEVPTATLEPLPSPTASSLPGVGSYVDGIAGIVTGTDGLPISNAVIVTSNEVAHSDADGVFALAGDAESEELHVFASGYADAFLNAVVGEPVSVQLEERDIKALYLNGASVGNDAMIEEMIRIINSTEANALVVDIKEGFVYYDTAVPFFRAAGAVEPRFDPTALVQRLQDEGIYVIARLVVFNDPVVAESRQDLAVKNTTGGTWRGWDGGAWVNPFFEELWDANIALAVEAAGLGFDEIQYDYVRFPSDGDLTTAEFGEGYTEEGRVAAITEFLKRSKAALEPLGTKLAADIFGIVLVYPDDQGIGQRPGDFAPYLDYICPMIYPSHFDEGSINVGGVPNAYPFETVELSLYLGMQKIEGMERMMRPWLQDFSIGEPAYGATQVRAQIDATMASGASGWMLWNAASDVTETALTPE